MIEDAFGSLDPMIARSARRAEPAFIHHTELKRHLTAILGDLGGPGLRPGQDLFRRPDGCAARRVATISPSPMLLARAPRHLVFGAALSAQLVAADLRAALGQRDGVSPALLERAGQEQLGGLDLPKPAARDRS